jgi:hypothetical protein
MGKPRIKVLMTEDQILEQLWDEEDVGDVDTGPNSDLDSDPDLGEEQHDVVYEVDVLVQVTYRWTGWGLVQPGFKNIFSFSSVSYDILYFIRVTDLCTTILTTFMQSCGSGSALNLSLSIFDFGLQILL